MKKRLLSIFAVMLMTLTANAQHEYVDLGLPSGTLWATCNVGANSPEEYGDYFAWGETEPKETYTNANYKFQTDGQMSKYNATDNITELMAGDDAATANWGSDWQMPSKAQMDELIDESNTTIEWTKENGVNGLKLTSTHNGKSIFMPAAGHQTRWADDVGRTGYYWSRSLNAEQVWEACFMTLDYSGYKSTDHVFRSYGYPVRPVLKKDKSGSLNGHDYVDLALPSGTLWATTNVGGKAPESCGWSKDYNCRYGYWAGQKGDEDYDYGFDWYYHDVKYYYFPDPYKEDYYLTKYCTDSERGYQGFTDNLTELLPEDDDATVKWGSEWQTPSKEQFEELINENYTTSEWTTLNGVEGRRITSKSNGNSIFLPAGGIGMLASWADLGPIMYKYELGAYWSRSLNANGCDQAYCLDFGENGIGINSFPRDWGLCFRAVLVKEPAPDPDATLPGDANNNGEVEIGDITSVLTLMATPDATGYNNKAADANQNGEIEIGDITTILTIMAEGN